MIAFETAGIWKYSLIKVLNVQAFEVQLLWWVVMFTKKYWSTTSIVDHDIYILGCRQPQEPPLLTNMIFFLINFLILGSI